MLSPDGKKPVDKEYGEKQKQEYGRIKYHFRQIEACQCSVKPGLEFLAQQAGLWKLHS
jgi:hypothetical protein